MMSEWMKVMLEEIERKRIEEDHALLEEKRREQEGDAEAVTRPSPPADRLEG
jgi:hypothetical protein